MQASKPTNMLRLLAVGALALLALAQPAEAQRPSLPALLAIVRFQNTACMGEQQDSGTCLADSECTRRAGQSVGPCANGFATCCSFKVSACVRRSSRSRTHRQPS